MGHLLELLRPRVHMINSRWLNGRHYDLVFDRQAKLYKWRDSDTGEVMAAHKSPLMAEMWFGDWQSEPGIASAIEARAAC